MKSKYKDIEKQLRQAIIDSEMSRYRICKEARISESQLSYFVNGQRTLTLKAAAKVAKVLGMELKPARKKKAR